MCCCHRRKYEYFSFLSCVFLIFFSIRHFFFKSTHTLCPHIHIIYIMYPSAEYEPTDTHRAAESVRKRQLPYIYIYVKFQNHWILLLLLQRFRYVLKSAVNHNNWQLEKAAAVAVTAMAASVDKLIMDKTARCQRVCEPNELCVNGKWPQTTWNTEDDGRGRWWLYMTTWRAQGGGGGTV